MTDQEMLSCPMRAGEGYCEPLKSAWKDSLAICCQPGYALISENICNALHAAFESGKRATIAEIQEPTRIMTSGEAFNCELCWFEHRELPYSGYAQSELKEGSVVVRIQMFREYYYGHIEQYGSYWRCWSRKPTEDQRRETPWLNRKEQAEKLAGDETWKALNS